MRENDPLLPTKAKDLGTPDHDLGTVLAQVTGGQGLPPWAIQIFASSDRFHSEPEPFVAPRKGMLLLLRSRLQKYWFEISFCLSVLGVSLAVAVPLVIFLKPTFQLADSQALILIGLAPPCTLVMLLPLVMKKIVASSTDQVITSALTRTRMHRVLSERFYERRSSYNVDEKRLLADFLSQNVLRPLLKKHLNHEHHLKLNLFLTAGSTVNAAAARLFLPENQLFKGCSVGVYTNSLTALEHIYHYRDHSILGKYLDPIELLEGVHSIEHRALEVRNERLLALRSMIQTSQEQGVLNIAVMSSAWLMGGPDYRRLTCVAHKEVFRDLMDTLVQTCDYALIVAPLSKFTVFAEINQLTQAVADAATAYAPYVVPDERRNNVFVLTTRRNDRSQSPLHGISTLLARLAESSGSACTENYRLWKVLPSFTVKSKDWSDIVSEDVPCGSAQRHLEAFYGV
jgi:hypothetical protein